MFTGIHTQTNIERDGGEKIEREKLMHKHNSVGQFRGSVMCNIPAILFGYHITSWELEVSLKFRIWTRKFCFFYQCTNQFILCAIFISHVMNILSLFVCYNIISVQTEDIIYNMDNLKFRFDVCHTRTIKVENTRRMIWARVKRGNKLTLIITTNHFSLIQYILYCFLFGQIDAFDSIAAGYYIWIIVMARSTIIIYSFIHSFIRKKEFSFFGECNTSSHAIPCCLMILFRY